MGRLRFLFEVPCVTVLHEMKPWIRCYYLCMLLRDSLDPGQEHGLEPWWSKPGEPVPSKHCQTFWFKIQIATGTCFSFLLLTKISLHIWKRQSRTAWVISNSSLLSRKREKSPWNKKAKIRGPEGASTQQHHRCTGLLWLKPELHIPVQSGILNVTKEVSCLPSPWWL